MLAQVFPEQDAADHRENNDPTIVFRSQDRQKYPKNRKMTKTQRKPISTFFNSMCAFTNTVVLSNTRYSGRFDTLRTCGAQIPMMLALVEVLFFNMLYIFTNQLTSRMEL